MRTRRQHLALCREYVGKMVVLYRDVTTRGGKTYKKGMRMRVSSTHRGRFELELVTPTGKTKIKGGCIAGFVRKVDRDVFEVVPE
jgi:hypothetical protein